LTFRDDLDLAADWADAYLARVAGLPVAARVEPGAVRASLPDAPPEHGEPFEALLRDPRHEQAVVNELRAVAEEVAADPRYADDEQMGPDNEARERFREFARKQLG